MNVRHLVPSWSLRLLSMGAIMLAAGLQQPVHASDVDLSKFRRIEAQYIAALGDPGGLHSGNGAQSWGLWSKKTLAHASCKLDLLPSIERMTGVAPSQWKFDAKDWWLEEHGLTAWRSRLFRCLLGNTSSRATAR